MSRRGSGFSTALVASGFDTSPEVDELVNDLRALYFVTGVDLMIRVGRLILERLYEGDEARWKSRRRKDLSFRKLQQHPGLPFKAAMLSRAVSIFVLSRRRPDLPNLQNVSQTHLQEILHLESAEQDRLLAQVQDEKWSVQRLRTAVRGLSIVTARPGRPRTSEFSRQLRNLRNILDNRLLVLNSANAAALQLREAQDLLEAARRLCQQAEQMARVLSTHVTTLQQEPHARSLAAPTRTDSDVVPRGVSSTKHRRLATTAAS